MKFIFYIHKIQEKPYDYIYFTSICLEARIIFDSLRPRLKIILMRASPMNIIMAGFIPTRFNQPVNWIIRHSQ